MVRRWKGFVLKAERTDYSIEEGSWTLSNAYLMEVGERATDSSYPERICRCCMRNGYLYVPAYNKKGIYKINVSNPADVTLIEFGFTASLGLALTMVVNAVPAMATVTPVAGGHEAKTEHEGEGTTSAHYVLNKPEYARVISSY